MLKAVEKFCRKIQQVLNLSKNQSNSPPGRSSDQFFRIYSSTFQKMPMLSPDPLIALFYYQELIYVHEKLSRSTIQGINIVF